MSTAFCGEKKKKKEAQDLKIQKIKKLVTHFSLAHFCYLSTLPVFFRPLPTVLNPIRGCFVELHAQVNYYSPPPLSLFLVLGLTCIFYARKCTQNPDL